MTSITNFSSLPKDISLEVFSHLSAKDLCKAGGVCKAWKALASENRLWKRIFQGDSSYRPIDDDKKDYKVLYLSLPYLFPRNLQLTPKHTIGLTPRISQSIPFACTFKNSTLFTQEQGNIVIYTWDLNSGAPQKIFIGNHWMLLDDNTLLSYGDPTTNNNRVFEIHDIKKGKLLHSFITEGIKCCCLSEHTLVLGMNDGSIQFLDVKHDSSLWWESTEKCIKTLYQKDEIACLHLLGAILAIGSSDGAIQIWNTKEEKCLHILTGHTSTITHLQLQGNILVSRSSDGTVKIWDINERKCLHTLPSSISCFQLKDNALITGSSNTIQIWNVTTGECLQTLKSHHSMITDLHLENNTLITGSVDGIVKVWDIETRKDPSPKNPIFENPISKGYSITNSLKWVIGSLILGKLLSKVAAYAVAFLSNDPFVVKDFSFH